MNRKMILPILIVIVGVILFIIGLNYEIPKRTFSFVTLKEYVGGDAYNAMIEASIRGGEIAAAKISKTIYICSGILTTVIGLAIATIGENNDKKPIIVEGKNEMN